MTFTAIFSTLLVLSFICADALNSLLSSLLPFLSLLLADACIAVHGWSCCSRCQAASKEDKEKYEKFSQYTWDNCYIANIDKSMLMVLNYSVYSSLGTSVSHASCTCTYMHLAIFVMYIYIYICYKVTTYVIGAIRVLSSHS